MISGISIAELEVLISNKRNELNKLIQQRDSAKEEIVYNAGNGQVGYYHTGTTDGLEIQIIRLKEEIGKLCTQRDAMQKANLERELNAPAMMQQRRLEERQRKEQEQQEQQLQAEMAKIAFNDVKRLYKGSTNFFERALLKIKGKGLKKEYTKEQLEYLLRTYYGNTYNTMKGHKKIEESVPFEERESAMRKADIKEFKRMVSSSSLDDFIKADEQLYKGRSK